MGDIAVATLHTPSMLYQLTSYPSSSSTSPSQMRPSPLAAAVAQFERINVVFNNAAYSILNEAEGMPDAVARETFDVALWDALAVGKETIRVVRSEVNRPAGGQLLNISSSAGIEPVPGLTNHGAAKSDGCVILTSMFVSRSQARAIVLIAFTEGLAKEVEPAWNTRVP